MPWSPLGQGFLTSTVGRGRSFDGNDIRSRFPRFTAEALDANQPVADLVFGQVEVEDVEVFRDPGRVGRLRDD